MQNNLNILDLQAERQMSEPLGLDKIPASVRMMLGNFADLYQQPQMPKMMPQMTVQKPQARPIIINRVQDASTLELVSEPQGGLKEASVNTPTAVEEPEENDVYVIQTEIRPEDVHFKEDVHSKEESKVQPKVQPKVETKAEENIDDKVRDLILKIIAKDMRGRIKADFQARGKSTSKSKVENELRRWYWDVGFEDVVINDRQITLYVHRPNKFIGTNNYLFYIRGVLSKFGYKLKLEKAVESSIYESFFGPTVKE